MNRIVSQPKDSSSLREVEILGIYAEGEAAVVRLVQGLLERLHRLNQFSSPAAPHLNHLPIGPSGSAEILWHYRHRLPPPHHPRLEPRGV